VQRSLRSGTSFKFKILKGHPLIHGFGRLENEVIVLRGSESEASSQMLKGVVVLCLPSSLKVDDVHLRMTGTSKIGYVEMDRTSNETC
jgi:hypothetical protein